MKFLSRILFYLSSFSILPPPRKIQELIIDEVERKNSEADPFLKRSLCQYDCHSHFFLKLIWISFNIFSIIFILPLFLVLVLRSVKKPIKTQLSDIALYPRIPHDIKQKFNPAYIKKPMGYLKSRDFSYISRIFFKSGFRPYFVFRSIWKIAVYSELMDTYSPDRIWVTQEMVFESSLLTSYLSDFQIKHINFMHGDNYFSIQVAFSTFSEFYVWNEFYIDLFRSLRCQAEAFHIFSALDRLTSTAIPKDIVKYYGQEIRSQKDFTQILNNLLNFAKNKNCQIVVRLHPLHKKEYQLKLLKEKNIEVENQHIDLVDSMFESKYVCSEFSSILYQASLLNRKIVIDNTFPQRMELIKDLDVIFLKKLEHEYLVNSSEKLRK